MAEKQHSTAHHHASENKVDAPAAKHEADEEPKKAVRMVSLSNKLPQRLTVSVDRGNGPEEVVLTPHGSSAPLAESTLTPYTLSLIEQGHVKKRELTAAAIVG